ncbi:2-vinyl bacteriochlorophyllide hydratase [Limnohabitans sp.]|jgi:3-vinyl bacteriochlorophyllide hydratase|uniref:2-vinyl bacteriochlorophyllide hydratase n=1 Tax=Limnohabitans sp. TaxID=1907725 RepID=UPI00286F14E4|nr:2-vinyl bacteriochlorophyllide hydratase [Limnohabitans sp.]
MPELASQVLYTPAQRARRDATAWTLVQGVLAPVQFLIFGISLYLVINSLQTSEHTDLALASVVLKTVVLYAIMVTGAIWEKVVFDCYLFAPAFFWEDVVSMGVMVLHTAYVCVWWLGAWSANDQLLLALAAYGSYAINAAQYIRKLRMARLQKTETLSMPDTGAQAST